MPVLLVDAGGLLHVAGKVRQAAEAHVRLAHLVRGQAGADDGKVERAGVGRATGVVVEVGEQPQGAHARRSPAIALAEAPELRTGGARVAEPVLGACGVVERLRRGGGGAGACGHLAERARRLGVASRAEERLGDVVADAEPLGGRCLAGRHVGVQPAGASLQVAGTQVDPADRQLVLRCEARQVGEVAGGVDGGIAVRRGRHGAAEVLAGSGPVAALEAQLAGPFPGLCAAPGAGHLVGGGERRLERRVRIARLVEGGHAHAPATVARERGRQPGEAGSHGGGVARPGRRLGGEEREPVADLRQVPGGGPVRLQSRLLLTRLLQRAAAADLRDPALAVSRRRGQAQVAFERAAALRVLSLRDAAAAEQVPAGPALDRVEPAAPVEQRGDARPVAPAGLRAGRQQDGSRRGVANLGQVAPQDRARAQVAPLLHGLERLARYVRRRGGGVRGRPIRDTEHGRRDGGGREQDEESDVLRYHSRSGSEESWRVLPGALAHGSRRAVPQRARPRRRALNASA